MTSDRWEQINRIWQAAVETEEKRRASFLDEACREDSELRREVESLLAMQAQADGFLEKPAVEEVVKAIKEEPPSLLGRKLGPYQILAALGAGGMGEVYKARDTRLNRTVAIKVLPRYLSQRADLRQRFEREARALASLSHPHVCPLHDIGREDGIDFLVMEYLEGETLARRLRKGALPLEQALQYGVEIAQALDEAHRHGVIHRDLKPGNIMLTKTGAKLLDFGLAKQGGTRAPARVDELAQATAVPGTRSTDSLTEDGMILGTLEYMAPEQVESKQADARTDIFALGVVLYEMVTGKKAFQGESKASLIAAILTSQPVTMIQPPTPPELERLVVRCLAKHPDDRIQTAHDAELLLRWIAEDHRSPAVTGTRQVPAGVMRPRFIIAAAIVALALAFAYLHHVWPQRLQATAFVLPPDNVTFNLLGDNAAPPVLSPDGGALVFGAGDQLWLRRLDELSPRPLSGTQGARFPFWSPDSKSLGFFAEGKLKVMEIATGAPIPIAGVSEARGGSWGTDGTIIFEPHWQAPLYRIPATGGVPVAITKIDQPRHTTHRWPHFLPDGKHFLYLALNHSGPRGPQNTVFIASLDGKVNRPLLQLSSNVQFAAGYVFYIRDNTLLAQRLNERTFQLEGKPVRIASGVVDDTTWRGGFTVSSAGTLAYLPGSGRPVAQMIWMDRSGKELEVVGEPADIVDLRLSPDGQRVAVNIDQDIYVVDIARGTPAKLTFNRGVNRSPIWSPDGKWIAYAISWPDSSETHVARKPSNGTGEEEILYSFRDDLLFPTAWSPDGRFLLLAHYLPADIEVLPLEGAREPYQAVPHLVEERGGTLSPDGRWLAYNSRESGRGEIYVVPFPGPGGKRLVSANGASTPALWSRDGKELYYADLSMAGHATAIRPSGNELTILDTRPILRGMNDPVGIDVAPDGRFLVARGSRMKPPSAIVLVTNWRAQVEE